MSRTIIAVADAARARLFTADRATDAGEIHETFVETTDLVSSARRLTPAEQFSDTRTSSNRAGGRHYANDSHVGAHLDAIDAEFANAITAAIEEAMRTTQAGRVIICAPPRMLGFLRAANLPHGSVIVDELARDYTKMSTAQIRELMTDHGLLPASPPRATFASR